MSDRSSINNNLFKKIYFSALKPINRHNLFNSVKDSLFTVQRLKLLHNLPVHNGCVNSISWSENGEYILSGSDDQKLCITNAYTTKVQKVIQTRHRTNIFSAKFLPNTNNQRVVSCSGDGIIMYTNVLRAEENVNNVFNCHFGTAYKIVSIPQDSNTFLSCGEDGTVRWYDLRMKTSCDGVNCCEEILVDCRRAVTALAINPLAPYELAVGCADNYVHIFDRRNLGTRATGSNFGDLDSSILSFTVPAFEHKSHRITSLVYSSNAEEMLVSYSSEYLYLFGLKGGMKTFSTTSTNEEATKSLSTPPPMKRWRLRGDWSDTGPNARPEREMQNVPQRPSVQSILIRRMSDVLTRILNQPSRNPRNNNENLDPSDASVNLVSEEGEIEAEEEIEESEERDPVVLITPVMVSIEDNSSQEPVDDHSVQEEPSRVEEKLPQVADTQTKQNSQSPQSEETHEDKKETSPSTTSTDSLPSTSTESTSPGQEVLQESLDTLEKQLSSRRKHFLKRHHVEPVVNLHYNAKGATSGLISMDMPSMSTSSSSAGPSTPFVDTGNEDKTDSVENDSKMEINEEISQETFTSTSVERSIEIPSISVEEATTSSPEQTARKLTRSHDDDEISSSSELSFTEEDDTSQWTTRHKEQPSEELEGHSLDEEYDEINEQILNGNKISKQTPILLQKFTGHRNARTMIKEANFWGEHYIISGSDCGHIFFWDRHTANVVMILEADRHVVNCVQPHPFDPVLASSGIDYDVKLWAPMEEEPNFDEKFTMEVMRRNEVMLEETRDTITVPASFMIRMLASLSNRRTPGARLRSALADRNNNNNNNNN